MQKKVKIEIGSSSATALMLFDDAPVTCARIWDSLPFAGELVHGIVTGREVFMPLAERLEIPPENQTIYPIEGDLVYYYKPINYVELNIPLVERDVEVISFIYGRDTQIFGPVLPLPVNHFAVLESGKEALVEEINAMRRSGFGTVTITRLKDQ